MKKFLVLILALMVVLSFAGCAVSDQQEEKTPDAEALLSMMSAYDFVREVYLPDEENRQENFIQLSKLYNVGWVFEEATFMAVADLLQTVFNLPTDDSWLEKIEEVVEDADLWIDFSGEKYMLRGNVKEIQDLVKEIAETPPKPPRPVGAYDDPNAVFTTELQPSSELKQIEVLINEEYLVCIDDPSKMTALCDMFLNAAPIPYTPKTFYHDATIYFEYTDGTITPITAFLNGFVYCLNDTYYSFAFHENGESLTLYTEEVLYDLLNVEDWDSVVKEKYRDMFNFFYVEKR